VIDRNACVGDVWSQRYDRLRLYTVYSGIAHYRLPRRYSKYPTKDHPRPVFHGLHPQPARPPVRANRDSRRLAKLIQNYLREK
jgi:hypothetical protein